MPTLNVYTRNYNILHYVSCYDQEIRYRRCNLPGGDTLASRRKWIAEQLPDQDVKGKIFEHLVTTE